MWKRLHRKRSCLNPLGHDDTGLIESFASVDKHGIGGSISIWDCARKINLSFWFDTEKEARLRAEKIDILIDHLTLMKTALGQGYEEAQKQNWFKNPQEED